MKKLIFIVGLLLGVAQAQTTTITGTIRDLTQASVTSGKVTFTLMPSRDTTISGVARFTPQTVVCLINGSGSVVAQDGVSPCVVTSNTSLQPPGTYYVVAIWPGNVKISVFTFYAVNASYDISTVVPTPTTSPAENFVDVFSNQTIGGNKISSGQVSFPGGVIGNNTFSGLNTFSALQTFLAGLNSNYFSSSAANPAASGVIRLASGDTACWRNQANSGDICISKNASDQVIIPALSLSGTTSFKRLDPTQATALVFADGALGGNWGTSPTYGVGGFDSAFRVVVTSGTGSPGVNPTFTLTFKDGTWFNAPVCVASRLDVVAPAAAYWAVDSTSVTTVRLTFVGTPATSSSYIANVICLGQ